MQYNYEKKGGGGVMKARSLRNRSGRITCVIDDLRGEMKLRWPYLIWFDLIWFDLIWFDLIWIGYEFEFEFELDFFSIRPLTLEF